MVKAQTTLLCIAKDWFPNISGGLNRYVDELTHELVSESIEIELCGTGFPANDNSLLKLTNLAQSDEFLPLRLWHTRKSFMKRQIKQPNAINLHFALYAFPLIFNLPKDVPVTFSFHGPWALESQREGANSFSVAAKKWLESQVYKRCDRFIVLSQAFGEILHQEYGIDYQKIHVIPGGVDVDRFQMDLSRTQAREKLGWSQERQILFTPRRLARRMGIDKLLEAVAMIKKRVPNVWLAIAGKGSMRAELEQKAADLGLADNVHFLGFLPDELLPIAYQAADLTVVPSQALEGFGLILLESLACGTPVLCTPVGGMPEVLRPFCPDLVTDSIEAEAIAERLDAFLTNKLSLPSREDCRNYAADNFNWEDIAQQVLEVLLLPKS
jgi:glycosyltransferase involved in cell wall biosynthesis